MMSSHFKCDKTFTHSTFIQGVLVIYNHSGVKHNSRLDRRLLCYSQSCGTLKMSLTGTFTHQNLLLSKSSVH